MKLSLRTLLRSASLARAALVLTGGVLAAGCLQRPVGIDQPKTTNVIVDNLKQSSVDKIDLLFMIDNSLSMGDKQALLAQALPDLVQRLVDPVCINGVDETDVRNPGPNGCDSGYAREFQPINNIHIGVITSSLGGTGAELDCTKAEEGETDNGHLLGSLDRVRAALPDTPTFLTWCRPDSDSANNGDCTVTPETSNGDAAAFAQVFANQVREAREQGCGWEASLEAWYHFLIDPYPWTQIVRQNCPFGNDTNQLCVGPQVDENGLPLVDQTIIEQREAFLRADSLLAIVMLTDENDCSFKASGQSWRLSQTVRTNPENPAERVSSRAYKGSAACAEDPNSECCVSCGAGVPSGCATTTNAKGETVSAGCEEAAYKSGDDLVFEGSNEVSDDAVNLRCFDQKRRFGVDYLYPVARYSNALKFSSICPFAETLDPQAKNLDGSLVCGDRQQYVKPNPLFEDLSFPKRSMMDPNAEPVIPRTVDLVFLAGIVGVPWQDLAVDPSSENLVYKTNNSANAPNIIDWVQLLGSDQVGAPYDLKNAPPGDPLMWEQIEPRPGTNPQINGGEWNILGKDDLQYACIFPRDMPQECEASNEGQETVACDCTYYGDEEFENPLCDGLTQHSAKAYPSIRPLQVLRDYGKNSIVASICPKNTTDRDAPDYGYRPAVAAIVDRLKEQLKDKCLQRTLEVKEVEGGKQASCLIVEADPNANGCDEGEARVEVDEAIAEKVRERLVRTNICTSKEQCATTFHLCGIQPLQPGTSDYQSCLTHDTPTGHGWCYIDPEQGLGDESQVEKCPETEKRKIKFAGAALPKKGTVTFFACAGAPQGVSAVGEGDEAAAGAAGM